MPHSVFVYVVDRDYGFAPNPFHGFCTLATCKPRIRNAALVGDWIVGMGGQRLNATGRLVFSMQVTEKTNYDSYWLGTRFAAKRPVRNGSKVMMVGDNIYHRDVETLAWIQADSHHSMADGTPNPLNIHNDTKSESVLISEDFFYFGSGAPLVSHDVLMSIGFTNLRGHRRFAEEQASPLIEWLTAHYQSSLNCVLADPFDFNHCQERYSP